MAEWKDVHSSSPVRTPKLQLTAEQSTGECWIKKKKKMPHVQGQIRSPNNTVGRVKSYLESNPVYLPETLRGLEQNFLCIMNWRPHRD